jgi:hypothetical protein
MNKLHVGVLLSGESIPAWVRRMLDRMRALPQVEMAAVMLLPQRSVPGRLFERYLDLDRRFFHPASSPWQAVPMPDLPLLRGSMVEHLVQLGSLRLDVLVNLALAEPPENLLPLARFGLWSLRGGRSRLLPESCPGWQELLEDELLTTCEVEAARAGLPAQIVARASLATDPQSVSRNQLRLLWRAASLLPRALVELSLRGEQDFFAAAPPAPPAEGPSRPGPLQIGRLGFKQAARKATETLRKRFTVDQWMLMSAPRSAGSLPDWDQFTPIRPPRDRSWADPFPVEQDGRRYVFLEEYPLSTKRGLIACLTLDKGGRVTGQAPALERPYHLSYPFVFERWGGWYMIPETAGNRAVELYRCTHFPDEWVFERTLLQDIHAVDATLLDDAGRWWLFANVVEEPGSSAWDSLHLYYSDDPLSADWIPHPLNPIVMDVRSARPAGRIFQHEGKWYRPSQVSVPRYGYALRLNRIDRLTTTEYAETCVETLTPPRGRNILAVHTLNSLGDMTVIDVQSRRLRF